MTNLNQINNKLPKEEGTGSIQDPPKLLAEFFNGAVIEIDQDYEYDS